MSNQNGFKRYVIIGNGVAGTTAAEALRKADAEASIIILAEEPYTLYNRVLLPKYLKDTISQAKVFVKDHAWHEDHKIDLRLSVRAQTVDTNDKTVLTSDGEELVYDALLVASGGRPNPCRVEGAQGVSGIYNFQTMDETNALREHMLSAKSAVSFGGSYISYELAEGFAHRGIETTWIMRGPRFIHRVLDPDGGKVVDMLARDHNVNVVYGETLERIESAQGRITGVVTDKGSRFSADMLGVGLGLTLNKECLEGTAVEMTHGIRTNEYLETNVPGVYAAGDIADFYNPIISDYNLMGTWDNAKAHGRVVGQTMAGNRTLHLDVPTYSSPLFASRIAAFGTAGEDLEESVATVDWELKTYRKLFFQNDHLVGGFMIGNIKGRRKYMEMIKEKVPVPPSERKALLDLT